MVGGFGEFIEKQFETVRDLAARGIAVWCLDWRGQGGSIRPRRLPTRPRARNFERDAEDLAAFAADKLSGQLPSLLLAHSMGGAITLLCLKRYPQLFAAAVLSSPMVGLRTGPLPPTLFRLITRPARAAGLGFCFIPGARKWRPDRLPSPERSRGTSDAERCWIRHAWFSADPRLRLDQATYGWVDSALALVARISKPEFLTGIDTPILIGRAGREVVVSPMAQRRAAHLLPNCTLVELPEFEARPVSRARRDPRLLAVLPRPLHRRAPGQDCALRVLAALTLVILAAAAARASAQGADRRVPVDPDAPPWDAIAKVQTNIGVHCTGVLIAPSVVLTAAHCLYNPRTRALAASRCRCMCCSAIGATNIAGIAWSRGSPSAPVSTARGERPSLAIGRGSTWWKRCR